MPIVPDDKNWTWVLERECPECGFDGSKIKWSDVASMLRKNAAEWVELLAHSQVRERPDDAHWSGLEYGCHVRDTVRIFHNRLQLMLDQHETKFANWDQDVTAALERYELQDATIVAGDLITECLRFASLIDTVTPDQLGYKALRSDGSAFTIDTFLRYFIHDPEHHVNDVRKGYRQLAVTSG